MTPKKNHLKGLLFFIFLLIGISVSAQKDAPIRLNVDKFSSSELDSIEIADGLIELEERIYNSRAIPIYNALLKKYPDDLYLNFRIGVAYLRKDDGAGKALKHLKKVRKKRSKRLEVNISLAEAYHHNYQFDKALGLLQQVRESNENIPPVWDKKMRRLTSNSKNAKKLTKEPLDVAIRNIGSTINSEGSEYVPVISSDESVLIFTYRGKRSTGGRRNVSNEPDKYGIYFEDIYISRRKEDGSWETPHPIEKLNGPGHDANIALSPDGQKLFTYQNNPANNGDIYVSHLKGEEWTKAKKLKGEVNTEDYWEGSASLSSDGKTLYFASTRKGGFGGRDLYTAELLEDSTWGNIQNMGPTINTEYDEDAPFIHPENTALFYSSKGHNSIGGYDIFRTDLEDSVWSDPINLGDPVNTTRDDKYYVISADGKRGYYSSGKIGGHGQQDIYVVEPGYVHGNPSLVLVKGNVTLCDEPVEASIRVIQEHNNEELGYYNSNSSSGKYLLNLPSGKSYFARFKLMEEKEGVDPIIKNINAIQVDSFVEIQKDIHFYTEGCRPDSMKDEKSVKDTLFKEKEDVVIRIDKKGSSIKVDTSEYVDMEYEDIVKQYGDMSADGLEFKIQVAAYEHPENYDYDHIDHLGKVERKEYGDGITRFTIDRSFNTLNEADDFLQKVIDAGQTDAFVLAFIDGERTYLQELIPSVEM